MPLRARALPVILSLLATAAWFAPARSDLGKWTSIGPYSGEVRDLSRDPGNSQRVFAATFQGGVFLSEDGGLHWTQRSQGLPLDPIARAYRPIEAVTAAAGRVYAAGNNIYSSDDNGASWSVFPRPSGATGSFEALLLDPDDPDKLTVENEKGVYVYELVGGVRTWVQTPGLEVPVAGLKRAPSDPDRFYAAAGYTLTLYRSTNRLGSWESVGALPGTEFRALAVDAADPDRLYLSVDTGCFVSPDGGQTWARMDDPSDDARIYTFAGVSGTLLGVGRGHVFSNLSHPDVLDPVTTFWHTTATSSVNLDDGTVLLGTMMGVFRGPASVAGGTGEFVPSNAGMNSAGISKVVPVPGTSVLYASSGVGFRGGVYRSDDNGATWELRSTGLTNMDVRSLIVSPGNPDVAYAGTLTRPDIGEEGKIFRTVDGGLTWTETGTLPHEGERIIITMLPHPTDPDIIYASVQGIGGGIYRSPDAGETWARTADGLEYMPFTPGHEEFYLYYAMLSMTVDPRNPSTLYLGAGGCWGGVYRSRDGGDTWVRRSSAYNGAVQAMEYDSQALDSGDPDFYFPVRLWLSSIEVDPNNSNHLLAAGSRGDYIFSDRQGILFESWDAGDNWSLVRRTARSDYFPEALTGLAINRLRPGEIYLSTESGVTYSLDGGSTWNDMDEGLGTQYMRGIWFDPDDPNRLYLATATQGIWVRDLLPVSVRLVHFEARDTGAGAVELTWGVADAVDHAGFYVDRETAGSRARITESLIQGREEFSFVDEAPVPGAVNRYWIVEVDRLGRETDLASRDVRLDVRAAGLTLGRAMPNPVRAGTRMLLTPDPGRHPVTVRVFDTRGRAVATLLDGERLDAPSWVAWDGRDGNGARVPGGAYFIQAASGDRSRVQRVLVIP